ncbi:MAG: SDR family oxidoreductase [Vicinamibacterales bacterium]
MNPEPRIVVLTGASGFIGSVVTERLLPRHAVRSLTSHPQKNRFGGRVQSVLYDFERPERMDPAFEGAETFVHSYYVRFPHAGETFERAVERAGVLLDRARRAGVRRIVHVSVSNADEASDLPYYRNKGRQERLVRESGLEFAILRPALVFGAGDILLNNIAWFLRRAPVFGVFGDGSCRVQPVAVDGFGALIAEAVESPDTGTITDVAGPIDYTYLDMVRLIRAAVGSRAALVRMPVSLALAASWVTGFIVRDVILTRDEAKGLMQEYLYSPNPRRVGMSLQDWLRRDDVRQYLGRTYSSELERHFR